MATTAPTLAPTTTELDFDSTATGNGVVEVQMMGREVVRPPDPLPLPPRAWLPLEARGADVPATEPDPEPPPQSVPFGFKKTTS